MNFLIKRRNYILNRNLYWKFPKICDRIILAAKEILLLYYIQKNITFYTEK